MDPLSGTIIVLGGLCGLGMILIICSKPCNRLDEEILYGEGCCNKYFNCCVSQQSVFYDDHNKINEDTKIKPLEP